MIVKCKAIFRYLRNLLQPIESFIHEAEVICLVLQPSQVSFLIYR